MTTPIRLSELEEEFVTREGYRILVDRVDSEILRTHAVRVYTSQSGLTKYVRIRKKGSRRETALHRVIMNAPKGSFVDHINGDGLDNRRSNLRFCSLAQNARNRRTNPKRAYKGVSQRNGVFNALICLNEKRMFLGAYDKVEYAALAYDIAAIELHKDFARTNFPIEIVRLISPEAVHSLARKASYKTDARKRQCLIPKVES